MTHRNVDAHSHAWLMRSRGSAEGVRGVRWAPGLGLWRWRCWRSWDGSLFCSVVLRCSGLCLVLLVLTCAAGDASGGGVVVAGFAGVCPGPACAPALAHVGLLVQGDERTCARLFDGCSWLVVGRSSRRAVWGAECRRAGLARAGLRWREPAFSLVRPCAAVTGLSDCGDDKEKVYGSIP